MCYFDLADLLLFVLLALFFLTFLIDCSLLLLYLAIFLSPFFFCSKFRKGRGNRNINWNGVIRSYWFWKPLFSRFFLVLFCFYFLSQNLPEIKHGFYVIIVSYPNS